MADDEDRGGLGAAGLCRYAPGDHWLVVAGRALLLLPEGTEPAFVQECWSSARSGAGIVELTSALARQGFSRFGDVVVAVIDTDSVRVVLRGDASVEQGGTVHDAEGRATWAEQVLPLQTVSLRLADRVEGPEIPLVDGVARVSVALWEIVPQAAPAPLDVPDAAAAGRHRAPDEVEVPVESDLAIAGPDTAAGTTAAVAPEAPVAVPDELDDAHGETLRDDELKAVVADVGPSAQADPLVPPPATEDDAPTALDEPDEDSYDRLFGATAFVSQHPSSTTAPPPVEPPASAAPPSTPTMPVEPPSSAPVDVRDETHPQPTEASDPPSSSTPSPLISGIPDWGQPTVSADAAASSEPGAAVRATVSETGTTASDADGAGLTISRAELQARRTAGPSIHGVRCPSGHPNPPEATLCRDCRLEIPLQAATTMQRPPLGALVLEGSSDGAPETISLDGAFILGRRPSVDRVTDTVPRLVTLPSPEQDLSRNHIRVNVEGWHVLVTDLGSKNGTMIVAPDEPPQRLHPDRPVMITPGTRVVLAEVVTYRYEATS